jgi:alpha-tubulin suppressor-like RCC1 family protein
MISEDHSLIIDTYGFLYVIGNNLNGQLGISNYINQYSPVYINYISDVVDASIGVQNSFILTKRGKVYSTGDNRNGILGLGHENKVNKFTLIQINDIIKIKSMERTTYLLDIRSNLYYFGESTEFIFYSIPTYFNQNFGFTDFSLGNYYALFLNNYGSVYCFGRNVYGQLGLGQEVGPINYAKINPFLSNIIEISCGYYSSLALDVNGLVYSFGYNKVKFSLKKVWTIGIGS